MSNYSADALLFLLNVIYYMKYKTYSTHSHLISRKPVILCASGLATPIIHRIQSSLKVFRRKLNYVDHTFRHSAEEPLCFFNVGSLRHLIVSWGCNRVVNGHDRPTIRPAGLPVSSHCNRGSGPFEIIVATRRRSEYMYNTGMWWR